MKMFEVEWFVSTGSHLATPYSTNWRNKKIFTEKQKADEFYKKLFEAAGLLMVSGHLEAQIHEVEIE